MDVQQALEDVFQRDGAEALPSPPVALRIAQLVRWGDWAIPEMARLAAADPAIAVDILCAPGAGRGSGRSASIPQALRRIGDRGLARIASRVAREADAIAHGPFAVQRRAAWRDALAAAVLCRELAHMRGLPEDDAYACGLLHDIGRIAGLSLVERLTAGASAPDAGALGWPPVVSRSHAELGAELAERRGLPAAVVDAIALHHCDAVQPARSPALVRVVRTIDAALRVFSMDEPRSEDLLALSDLAWWEAERIGDLRPGVTARVVALDLDEPLPMASSRARRPAARRGTMVLRVAGREYAATDFAAHELTVVGPVPLGEGALVEVERIEPSGPTFLARVALSWTEGDRHRSVLVPIAVCIPSGLPPEPVIA